MNILFLDVYKKSWSRISKDTAGGYGTENDLGDSFFGRLISFIIKQFIFWPNLSFVQLMQELKSYGHKVLYKKHIGLYNYKGNWDVIFVCGSIVCFETEIANIINIKKKKKIPIFYCGTFPKYSLDKIPKSVTVLSGNYEFFLQKVTSEKSNIISYSNERLIHFSNGDSDSLSQIDWKKNGLPKTKNLILGKSSNYFPFISSRGCPYTCREYCTYPTSQGIKVNRQNNFETIKKLKIISRDSPGSHVIFRDPVFSLNIKETKSLLNLIYRENLDLQFSAELHLKNIDDDFIELCKKAKFSGLKFGIESAIPDVRDSVNRFSVSNDIQKNMIDKINNAGLKTIGMFILAQPMDTFDTCMETIKYACSLNLSVAQFSIFTPYPGTPFFISNQNLIDEGHYENFNQYNLVYKHKEFTKKQARKLLELAYRKFIISKLMKKVKFN